MSEEKRELKPEVVELAGKLKGDISLDQKTGIGSAEKDLYEENLPEGLTKKTVKSVRDYDTTFVAAATSAFGDLSNDAMAKNSKLDRTSLELKSGLGITTNVAIERTKSYENHLTGGEPTVKYGVSKVGVTFAAGKNAGQLKIARELLNDAAAEAFGK